MPKYGVELHGQNYLLRFDEAEEPKPAGFYTRRGVRAKNIDRAVEKALKKVQQSRRLNKMMCNAEEDSPVLYVEEVVELTPDADLQEWEQGFVFYVEEDEAQSTV